MVTLENYELQYNLFLAEQDLFESMIDLGASAITESSGLISIHEGVKETILNYLGKIMKALENAWTKFKEIVTNAKDKAYLKMIAKKMQEPDPKFTMRDFPIYDFTLLDGIQIVPFNYDQIKDDLESSTNFINAHYKALMKDPEKSLQENISSIVIRSRSNTRCTGTILKSMYNFVCDEFPRKMSKLENDLKSMNTSSKNIETLISQIAPTQSTSESVAIYESYLLEAEEENKAKPKFVDDPGTESSGNSKGDKTTLIKQVTTYMKVSSDIISSKMKCYRDIYALYMQTIKHYIKPESDDSKKKEESGQKAQTDDKQIKI